MRTPSGSAWRQLGELGIDPLAARPGVGTAQREHQTLDGLAAAVAGDGAVAGQGGKRTCATSAIRTGSARSPPTTMAATSSSVRIAPWLRTSRTSSPSFRRPAPSLRLLRSGHRGGDRARSPCGHTGVVRHHLEAGDEAAEGVDFRHAGDRAQGRADRPVEQVAALGQRQVAALDAEHEHLAERRGHGGDPAVDAVGQIAPDGVEAVGHLLARPIDVRPSAKSTVMSVSAYWRWSAASSGSGCRASPARSGR